MTTTTVEYWSVFDDAGTEYPLQTYAKNIETWGDDRQSVIPMRGEDTTIPHVPGAREEPRTPDARTMSLGMWVKGTDDDNNRAVPAYQQFRQNWRQLQRILYNEGRTIRLRKRFYDEAYNLRTAEARCKYEDGISPSMMGQHGARFTVGFRLADPFFYEVTPSNIAVVTAVNPSVTSTVSGQFRPRKIVFTGTANALTSGFSISCPTTGYTWSLDGSMNNGEAIYIDFAANICRVNNFTRTANVHHSGGNDWMRFGIGSNLINIGLTLGSVSGTFTYSNVWH